MNEGNIFRFDLWLYNEMKKRGWNCLDLATESGVSEKSIYSYLREDRFPNWKNLILLLNAFGKHIEFADN